MLIRIRNVRFAVTHYANNGASPSTQNDTWQISHLTPGRNNQQSLHSSQFLVFEIFVADTNTDRRGEEAYVDLQS